LPRLENRCLGIVEVDIKLGNEKLTRPVYEAPIGDGELLGCDNIDEKDITINFVVKPKDVQTE
jgi:hypothetical protein